MNRASLLSRVGRSVLLSASKAYERLTGNCLVVETKTWWGSRMLVSLPEPASVQIFLDGQMDPNLTEFLCHALKPGQTFVDVGAHLGYFSLLAQHLVRPSGQVVAFEPAPQTFALLARNAARAGSIQVHALALWSESAELPFNTYGQRFSAYNSFFGPRVAPAYLHRLRKRSISVNATSLDEFLSQHPMAVHCIKIDAESAELAILRGAVRTLATHKPVVIAEVGDLGVDSAPKSAQMVDFLCKQGYQAWEWRAGTLHPHAVQDQYEAGNLIFIHQERTQDV